MDPKSLYCARTAKGCETLWCPRTPTSSKSPSPITALYYFYNCQLETVASFESVFGWTLFHQLLYK